MQLENITLYNGECIEIMKTLQDKSIDMILCDLPYGVLNKSNKEAQWDSIIPMQDLWEQYKRVIKDKGNIVLFSQGLFTAELIMSNKKMWKYNLVWKKGKRTTGFLNSNRQPLRQHEDIVIFNTGQGTYNPQMITENKTHNRGGEKKNGCYGKNKVLDTWQTNEKYPASILDFDKDIKQVHPTQKPINLLRWLIRTYSNESETILDNTMGSGSTMVACVKEKRKGIGIELTKKYFDIAVERVKEAQKNTTIFDYL